MRLSSELEEAVFVFSDDDLLGFLSEDVIHDMETGDFSPDRVAEAFVEIFTLYRLDESDVSIVEESIDEFGVSMGLEEGFLDWLKGAAKSALKAVGQAAMDAAKEGGKQAISTSAAELKKRIKAKEKKEPPEPPQPEGTEKKEPEEKPKKKSPKKGQKKKAEKEEPEEKPEKKAHKKGEKKKAKEPEEPEDTEEPEEPKPKPKKKPKQAPKKEPESDEDDEPDDIKQNLKNIASKALGKIADNPEQAKEILKKHGKKAVRALAKHGVKKGMKMVFGRWVKDKGGKGSKKEALEWLIDHSGVYSLQEGRNVYDFEGTVPFWIFQALGSEVREEIDGLRYEFVSGRLSRFMMAETR